MKLLFWGNINSIYLWSLATWLKRTSPEPLTIDMITTAAARKDLDLAGPSAPFDEVTELPPVGQRHLHRKLAIVADLMRSVRTITRVPRQYDCCHIHFLDLQAALVAPYLRSRARRLLITYWGSDFYRSPRRRRMAAVPALLLAHRVTFVQPALLQSVRRAFPFLDQRKLRVCPFGLSTLDDVDDLSHIDRSEAKEKLGLSADAFAIACGYGGDPNQRHARIIEEIARIRDDLPENTVLLLPMTYGGDEAYRSQIRRQLQCAGLDHRLFSEFLGGKEMALIRKASDVMINVQTTDQLSGSMMEHLYARSVVVNGSWLPYDVLYELGVYAIRIDRLDALGECLIACCRDFQRHFEQTARNPAIIGKTVKWDQTIRCWRDLYWPAHSTSP